MHGACGAHPRRGRRRSLRYQSSPPRILDPARRRAAPAKAAKRRRTHLIWHPRRRRDVRRSSLAGRQGFRNRRYRSQGGLRGLSAGRAFLEAHVRLPARAHGRSGKHGSQAAGVPVTGTASGKADFAGYHGCRPDARIEQSWSCCAAGCLADARKPEQYATNQLAALQSGRHDAQARRSACASCRSRRCNRANQVR